MQIRGLAYVVVLASSSTARADCDPAPLRARLEDEAHRVAIWRWGWAIGFGAAAVGQAIGAAVIDDPDQRAVFATSAAKAALGAGARIVVPVRVELPPPTGDACADELALRAATARAGRRERDAFWLNHIGGFAVNLAGAAYLTWKTRWQLGAISFAIGYPVGLASTYTMPRGAWHAAVAPVDGGGATVGVSGAW